MEEWREILEKEGWTIQCESPFELQHEDGSFASGQAAQYVVEGLREEAQDEKEEEEQPSNYELLNELKRTRRDIKDVQDTLCDILSLIETIKRHVQ